MKNTFLFALLILSSFILITSCEKEEINMNESIVQNYQGKKDHKITLCVEKGNGNWHKIEVAKKSLNAHLRKGAVEPGDCIGPGKRMNQECRIVDAFEDNATDGIDNDCDGLIDCEDPDCVDFADCSRGCPAADDLLAATFDYKSLYISTHIPDFYASEFMRYQGIAIRYCEDYSEPSYEDWRLGSYAEYEKYDALCNSVHSPNDRRPNGLPGVPILTADTESMSNQYNPYYPGGGGGYGEEEEESFEIPRLFTGRSSYPSSTYGVSYIVLCVHDK